MLRPLVPSDREAFLARAEASRALHEEWVSPPREASAYDAYLARRGPSFLGLGVFLQDRVTVVGVYNMSQIVYGPFCNAYLAYYVFAGYERRGLMSEGLEMVMRLSFECMGLHRLEANTQPENLRSIRLVQRSGFQREGYSPAYLRIAGVWRDHERWAIRQEIWTPRPGFALAGPEVD
jgi:ribosomal-protein-alanine N-acetyltransferase